MKTESTETMGKQAIQVKFGSNGWQQIGEYPDDPVRQSVTQRLTQRVLDTHIVCLIGSGVSLGVKGPGMSDFWALAKAHKHFDHALTRSEHPKSKKDIEAFLSRCRMAEQFQAEDQKLTDFIRDIQKGITAKCRDFLTPETELPAHRGFLQRLARRSSDSP